MVCGDESLGSEPQSLHYLQRYNIFRGTGERNRGYALLMTAIKPETVVYGAPTFSLLLVSCGGVSSWNGAEFQIHLFPALLANSINSL